MPLKVEKSMRENPLKSAVKNVTSAWLGYAGIVLGIGMFIIDIETPLGVADGISYIAVLLLTIWADSRNIRRFVTLMIILFIVAGYYFSPPNNGINFASANRMLSVAAVLICSMIIGRYKRSEEIIASQQQDLLKLADQLTCANLDLEERVKARTMILEEALNELEESRESLQSTLKKEKELGEIKSRFVSVVSHEFRTPLATILSSLALVSRYSELGQKEDEARHISKIKTSIAHLTDLLNDVLSLSRLEEGRVVTNPECVYIRKTIEEALVEMRAILKPGQKISYNHFGGEEVHTDRKLLWHIFSNLVSNAIKFSPENGQINVKTEVSGDHFNLVVSDQGIGMSEEDQRHLFERFFRGNNASAIQGTGLGLNIVAKNVELLGGTIDFRSRIREGTTVSVKLPLPAAANLSGEPGITNQQLNR